MDTKVKIFDYGNSFVMSFGGDDNSPRFLVDSICTVNDRGNTDKYYLAKNCKGENTYDRKDLFMTTSFDLFPVFHKDSTLAFRKFKYYIPTEKGEYKRTYKKGKMWGDREFLIKEVDGELLDTPKKNN